MSIFVDIEKTVGDFHLKVNFSAQDEVLALLGASGCGKSMTVKCIAGVEKPDRGRIVLDGVTLFDSERHINVSPQQRHTGLLFQNYALFPNMTVRQNIQTGARREADSAKREAHVRRIVERFGLSELLEHYPHQLSGGQQQRVALARLLVSDPQIVLLDEPFSALDSHLRFLLEQEVGRVLRSFGKTAILVSHDRDEVFRLSDRIAVMDHGRIDVCGTRHEVFLHPETRMAAILTGCKNVQEARYQDAGHVFVPVWNAVLEVPGCTPSVRYVGVRMREVCPGPGPNALDCRVLEEIENPFSFTVLLEASENGIPIQWDLPKPLWEQLRGERVRIHIPLERIMLLER